MEEVVMMLGDMGTRVCILGGTKFQDRHTEELVQMVAQELSRSLGTRAIFLTGGMPGVQETFAKNCVFESQVYNLLPAGQSSKYGVGKDICAGTTLAERIQVFGQLGDIYITFEGGPGVSKEAHAAFARAACVVPLMRTGGASAGMFNFPPGALEKPSFATEEQWALLANSMVPPKDSAEAAVEAALAYIAMSTAEWPSLSSCPLRKAGSGDASPSRASMPTGEEPSLSSQVGPGDASPGRASTMTAISDKNSGQFWLVTSFRALLCVALGGVCLYASLHSTSSCFGTWVRVQGISFVAMIPLLNVKYSIRIDTDWGFQSCRLRLGAMYLAVLLCFFNFSWFFVGFRVYVNCDTNCKDEKLWWVVMLCMGVCGFTVIEVIKRLIVRRQMNRKFSKVAADTCPV
eukprot:gnl/TRDRNA2_/TRDRNA2_132600_c0_seq1.p1 gnl/TRDRNA2_/TRDRNA2_132600_c0~~gnl/TRDRNA2_/TRDRNA2_132600_c0_seq1.p1  ORF type:complete len:439 (-),score=64.86 gnl/TRDRNA2_/TRDRNA2_132600_c0_seq1:249-1457(-)